MLKRLLFGLLFGLLVGGLLAAAVIKGVGMFAFTGSTGAVVLAYVFAAVTGVLVGLVAGKPIWASGGQIEAGLKAVVGGGAVGGALAWSFARRGVSVTVVEAGRIGRGASYAAAGVLSPDWSGEDPPPLTALADALGRAVAAAQDDM